MTEDTKDVWLARLDEKLSAIRDDIHELRTDMVTQDEFDPIRKVVYGMVGMILCSMLVAIVAVVLK